MNSHSGWMRRFRMYDNEMNIRLHYAGKFVILTTYSGYKKYWHIPVVSNEAFF